MATQRGLMPIALWLGVREYGGIWRHGVRARTSWICCPQQSKIPLPFVLPFPTSIPPDPTVLSYPQPERNGHQPALHCNLSRKADVVISMLVLAMLYQPPPSDVQCAAYHHPSQHFGRPWKREKSGSIVDCRRRWGFQGFMVSVFSISFLTQTTTDHRFLPLASRPCTGRREVRNAPPNRLFAQMVLPHYYPVPPLNHSP